MKVYKKVFLLLIFSICFSCSNNNISKNSATKITTENTASITTSSQLDKDTKPKNIILMISDGCGFNQLNATSFYQYDKLGNQIYENFPIKYSVSTYSSSGSYLPNKSTEIKYLLTNPTDSAAAATAMATGNKTYNTSIGFSIKKEPLKNLTQIAYEKGLSTGVITSVPFNHATPASFVAHNLERDNYNEIAIEMISKSTLNVIMGAGNPTYNNNNVKIQQPNYKYLDKTTWNKIENSTFETVDIDNDDIPDNWKYIKNKADFQKLITGDTPKRVLGIAKCSDTLQEMREPVNDKEPYITSQNQNVPTLSEMVLGGLNVLDNNKNGFFLMIEGGAIDWANHSNLKSRMVEEQISFNKAVEDVVQWIEKNSSFDDTLLIITADHESGMLTGTTSFDITSNGINKLPDMKYNSTGHSNSLVPLFAKGFNSNLFHSFANKTDSSRGKYIDNTNIFKVISESILN